jgi:hypothetical protein
MINGPISGIMKTATPKTNARPHPSCPSTSSLVSLVNQCYSRECGHSVLQVTWVESFRNLLGVARPAAQIFGPFQESYTRTRSR